MLGSGLAIPAIWSRPVPMLNGRSIPHATSSSLALAGVGDSGVTDGFGALVDSYSATAGRYRLSASGFAICAADEERLCYNSDGTFRGQYLQGADTYFSAPWHDAAQPSGSGDPIYLSGGGSGKITYPGDHVEDDIFGGTGGGVVLTDIGWNQYHTANNTKATGVATNDVLRYQAIVCIEGATTAGRVDIRGGGNVAFAFTFDHDASGNITGFTENWGTYRAGYHDMGTINGKRWWYLWVDRAATSANDAQPGIGFGNTAPDTGKTYHVCELMVQKNPACAPAAVPVCAQAKTFAADTLATSLSDAGYVCEGLAMARSQMPLGNITAPAVSIGVPYEPLETRIGIFEGAEVAARSGILHNENQTDYLAPWKTPTTHSVNLGPTFLPADWHPGETAKGCTNYTIEPVFKVRRDLRPILGPVAISSTWVTGTITADGCIWLGAGDKPDTYWQQTSIRSSTGATFFLTAGANIYTRDGLVMGSSLHTTRARYEIQEDDTPERQVYVGEFLPQPAGNGVIDFSGTRFDRLARVQVSGTNSATAVALNADDVAFDYIWSDPIFWGSGAYANPQLSRRFNGRTTAIADMSMWQSRKEIEVDTGSGYVDFSASGLSIEDLPHGALAQFVGTYDFDTDTLTPGTDADKAHRIRYYHNVAMTGQISRPGLEWQSSQIDYGTYSRYQTKGDVFEIDTGTLKVRFYYDTGYWFSGPTYTQTTTPAATATGTHPDNLQVNRLGVDITGAVQNDIVMLNAAQGHFHTGLSGGGGSSITGGSLARVVGILADISNAHRFDHSSAASSTESITDSVLIQAAGPFRFADGTGVAMTLGAASANNTLTVSNLTVASAAGDPDASSDGGTMSGAIEHVTLPRATGYSGFTSVTDGSVTLDDLLNAGDIHSSGQAEPVTDPWNFAFANSAAAALGFDANAVLTLAKGDHQEWDSVIASLASIYFREPDHYDAIADSAAVGTVVASGISAEQWHARYGANGEGYFAIDGTDVKVAKPLTGLDRIFVLRGSNDETFVVDVS